MIINSKLPQVGTSIFTIISALSEEHKAINLAQGFPNFDCDEKLQDLVAFYLKNEKNQYAPMAGLLALRHQISIKFFEQYHIEINPVDEITITAGATQALFTAIAAFISPQDEVIIIEPAYDSYAPAIWTMGGIVKYFTSNPPDFKIDFEELSSLISSKTKMIIINNPGNPSTKIWTKDQLIQLANIVKEKDIIVLSDEVYEHLVYDDKKHIPSLSLSEIFDQVLSVYSFGKTFHNTGWKVGYIVGHKSLMNEFRKVHQFNVFCVNSFVQYGLAKYLEIHNEWTQLPNFYQRKRDLLSAHLNASPYKEITSEGSFFSLYDYSKVSQEKDQDFVLKLIKEKGVAVIPLSSFYHSAPKNMHYIRLCFAKHEDTLLEASRRLMGI
ncbi:MAG: hypothetical protein RLZZ546_2929 [Bacteroidota bacterium]|jgi:methionine aminotransferase